VKQIDLEIARWTQDIALPQIAARQKDEPVSAPLFARRTLLDEARLQLAQFGRTKAMAFEEANARTERQRNLQTGGFALLTLLAIAFLVASSRTSFRVFRSHLRQVETAQALTEAIVETTSDAVVTLDESGRVRSMNPGAEKMFQVETGELLGQSVARLIPQPHFFRELTELGSGTMIAAGRRPGTAMLFPLELSVNSMKLHGRKHSVAIIRDTTERRRTEETLKHISLGVSAATGEEFVKSLVQQLSRALQSDFAFVIQTTGSSSTCLLTLAESGEMHSTGNFDLTETACADVVTGGFRACLHHARAKYPNDAMLAGLEIESFIAMPLVDHHGRAVGAMGVLGRSAAKNVQVVESTLRIFAARAAAELERKRFAEDLARRRIASR
jgi:PAS domain S-box-containing protein